jgi:hypothetical protein
MAGDADPYAATRHPAALARRLGTARGVHRGIRLVGDEAAGWVAGLDRVCRVAEAITALLDGLHIRGAPP